MKQKTFHRFLSVILAFAMVISLMPMGVFAADGENVHVLDATTDLTAFTQGERADGDTEVVGDYFTIMYSAKNKVDASNKTFDDGYTAAQRLNFGGKTDPEKGMINSVKFTTENPATVKIWWVSGGDGRNMAVYDNAGTVLTETTDASVKNGLYISTLSVEEAGTYYLGVPQGSNYLFKVEVTEIPQAKDYILDATADMTAFTQGERADGDTEVFHDYFTVMYSAKNKVDGSSKTFDDGYTATQRLNFGGKTDPEKGMINSVKFTTSGSAEVKVWWVSGGDGRNMGIYSSAGALLMETSDVSVKNSLYISTLTLEEAGTYYLGVPQGSNYLFKVHVHENGGAGPKPPRTDWAQVAAPVITAAAQNGGNVEVTVSASVGYDGADEILVSMLDANSNELATRRSIAEKDEHTVSFTPDASGTYSFVATMNRADCESKVSEVVSGDFILPLAAPKLASATSSGGGNVSLVWGAVPEAESYEIYVGAALDGTTTELSYEVQALAVGVEYAFSVVAVRGEDRSPASEPVSVLVTEEAQRVWGFTRYGSSTNDSSNGYVGDMNRDGQVTVYSEGGKGKIVPNSTEGVAFYYTAIPADQNFTLRAKVTVDKWTLSNGQEGFGIMAADRLGPNGDGTSFWNNQYMAIGSKIEYVTNKGKYSMKLGLGTLVKTGVTAENLDKLNASDTETINREFHSEIGTLDHTPDDLGHSGGTYNIIGNYTKDPGNTVADLTTFILEVQRNNTGYYISRYDEEGNLLYQRKDYDPNALTMVDKDNVYVGFFAARNARATFSDVTLTTIAPEDDLPAEERPITYVTPSVSVTSSSTANSENYQLYLHANVIGDAVVTVGGTELAPVTLNAGERKDIPVTVNPGENAVTVVFTPDADQDLGEYTELTSADPITVNFKVRYETKWAGVETLYVSPEGKADAAGTKADPLEIGTAIRNAQAGQTIVVLGGTYHLSYDLRIDHGMDGTEEKPIRMVAETGTRPVLDFQKKASGFTMGGDYWYFFGFDVTNSSNGNKGIQVSGHHNTLDQINTYCNGNTGIQISRLSGTDPHWEWPSYNLILNCTSYNNADRGYEDADGFAAKLTCGEGNVFDGCIAYNNADDGWDLYAKVETGSIGMVTIKNSVAYQNGYVMEDGVLVNAGNGNGFKMGGESLSGKHTLINSFAFFNKAKGFDSNSCPDIRVENSTSYNNEGANVAFYTNTAANTDYRATGIVSFKDETVKSGYGEGENHKPKGTQDTALYLGDSNYYWNGSASVNASGKAVTAADFVSLEFAGITRNADGTINMNGFLELKDAAAVGAGAVASGTPSAEIVVNPFVDLHAEDLWYEASMWAVGNGIINGMTESTFVPHRESNRAQVVTMLWRAAGSPEAQGENPFTDVPAGEWYTEAVLWAVEKGIVNGMTATTFGPEVICNRAQMVTMLYRAAGSPAVEGEHPFTDVPADAWYTDAVLWAVRKGITTGTTETTFSPENLCTRAQAILFLYRAK